MTLCLISGCERIVLARSLCGRHYQRWAKYGNPVEPHRTRSTRIPWIEAVALTWESDDCLPWPFSFRDRYPALIGTYAHIYICERVHGPKPSPDHETEHTCGHEWCVNKRHIQWATHPENCARRTEHGTQTIGERHPGAILSEDDVRAIRATPCVRGSGVHLAKIYGVTASTISQIRTGKNWSHVT